MFIFTGWVWCGFTSIYKAPTACRALEAGMGSRTQEGHVPQESKHMYLHSHVLDSTVNGRLGLKRESIISPVSSWKSADNSSFSASSLFSFRRPFAQSDPCGGEAWRIRDYFWQGSWAGVGSQDGLIQGGYLRTGQGVTSTWCTVPNPAAVVRPFAPW